jgi:protein-S-isoprenylcysteine O-methyltransferase Ste14
MPDRLAGRGAVSGHNGGTDRKSPGKDSPGKDSPGVIAPPPVIYLAGLALAFALDWIWPIALLPGAVQVAVGILLIVLGLSVVVMAFIRFRRAGTHIEPHKPTTAIVTDGLYGVSRNPIYVALAVISVGIAIAADNIWVLPMLVPTLMVMRAGVIAREEKYLEGKFGEEYRRYKAAVRRWL